MFLISHIPQETVYLVLWRDPQPKVFEEGGEPAGQREPWLCGSHSSLVGLVLLARLRPHIPMF